MSNGDRKYPGKIDTTEGKRKFDVFTRLDWMRNKDGFRDIQEECRQWLKEWLQKEYGWSTEQLHEFATVKWCELPNTDVDGDWAVEALAIKEREVWWRIPENPDDPDHVELGEQMQHYKSKNKKWLEDRRKQVWNAAEGNDPDAKKGWDRNNREKRYEYLQIATKYGSAWDEWKKTHNTDTGAKKKSTSNTRHKLSEHFIIEEFDCNDGTKCGSREYDGLEYLCKTFLEPLRDAYGTVTINSGFRTPNYNAQVGGEPNSFHIYTAHDGDDQAADITCAKGTPSQWHSKLNSIRQNKRGGKGGLGLYSTFVHVDIRDYKADWRG